MAELSSVTKHFKKGKLHHTIVRLADEDRISEYMIPAKDRFKVFDKERLIFFKDCCIPFPKECKELTFMGFLDSSIIFTSDTGYGCQKMISISPTSPQPIVMIETFDHHWLHKEGFEHPVIKRLLEVNDAKEMHIFTNSREEKVKEEAVMFAVGHDDELIHIKFCVFRGWGGIDRLIQSDGSSDRGLIHSHTVFDIIERKTFLLGRRTDCEDGTDPIICGPNDVVEPGKLFWQSI